MKTCSSRQLPYMQAYRCNFLRLESQLKYWIILNGKLNLVLFVVQTLFHLFYHIKCDSWYVAISSKIESTCVGENAANFGWGNRYLFHCCTNLTTFPCSFQSKYCTILSTTLVQPNRIRTRRKKISADAKLYGQFVSNVRSSVHITSVQQHQRR